jgi:ABC-type Fe3+ transport system permease subunit
VDQVDDVGGQPDAAAAAAVVMMMVVVAAMVMVVVVGRRTSQHRNGQKHGDRSAEDELDFRVHFFSPFVVFGWGFCLFGDPVFFLTPI